MGRLVINGNQVYEIDEECMKKKKLAEKKNVRQEQNVVEKGGKPSR